jgi:glycosyltransferase involved in cell wall biosynthesis
MKTKILYDYQIFSEQSHGGISRYICELASHMTQFDEFEPKILGFAHRNYYLKHLDPHLKIATEIPFIPKTQRLRRAINRALFKIFSPFQLGSIIHETYYAPERIAPKNCKVVLTVHDMIHEKFSHYFPRFDQTAAMKAIALQRADRIICVSENTRKDLLNYFNIDPQRISVIHLGCSFATTIPAQADSIATTKPYILYVGKREFYKNFSCLLHAYAFSTPLNQDFDLICFGGLPFSRAEYTEFTQLGLSAKQIKRITGNDQILADLYKNAAVFVYPSFYEGFGIPPLEAMMCGCPVICSNASSIPEVVGNAGEYFNPLEPESLMEALQTVLNSSVRQQQLCQLGSKRVQQFSWQMCAEKTCSVYKSLI